MTHSTTDEVPVLYYIFNNNIIIIVVITFIIDCAFLSVFSCSFLLTRGVNSSSRSSGTAFEELPSASSLSSELSPATLPNHYVTGVDVTQKKELKKIIKNKIMSK